MRPPPKVAMFSAGKRTFGRYRVVKDSNLYLGGKRRLALISRSQSRVAILIETAHELFVAGSTL